ncbi:MAG: Wall-associated protein, partial [Rhodocyclales bacterium]|nr:Wall-associated protein [Rhodocyclales bacterium]
PTISSNLRLPGQYFDEETALHYNWHRYYDPSIGRYISADPIGLNGGVNTYVYVEGGPTQYMDTLGLQPKDKHYGYPPDFWSWYHQNVKKPGDPDLDKEGAKEEYDEWVDLGKPPPDKKKGPKNKPAAPPPEAPEPSKSSMCGPRCQGILLVGGVCLVCVLQPELCPIVVGGGVLAN